MDPSEFALAIVPPAFAMFVEWVNPLTEEYIRSSMETDLNNFQVDENHEILIEDATFAASAAVEIAGIAPTFVSTITSGFAIIRVVSKPLLYTIPYTLIFMGLVIFVIRLLAGKSLYKIHSERPSILWRGTDKKLPFRTTIIRIVIYLLNLLLIILASVVYSLNYT